MASACPEVQPASRRKRRSDSLQSASRRFPAGFPAFAGFAPVVERQREAEVPVRAILRRHNINPSLAMFSGRKVSRRTLAVQKSGTGFRKESERLSSGPRCYPQFTQAHTTYRLERLLPTQVLDVRLATRLACRGADLRPAADLKGSVGTSPEQRPSPAASVLPRGLRRPREARLRRVARDDLQNGLSKRRTNCGPVGCGVSRGHGDVLSQTFRM